MATAPRQNPLRKLWCAECVNTAIRGKGANLMWIVSERPDLSRMDLFNEGRQVGLAVPIILCGIRLSSPGPKPSKTRIRLI
jgi:hypothetical protein